MSRYALRNFILLIAGRLLKWSTVDSLPQAGFLRATLPPDDPTLGEQANTQTCRLIQDFGFRSAPVPGSEVIVSAPRGGPVNAVVVASDNLSYGRTNLASGESQHYNSVSGTELYLDKNGNANLSSGTPAMGPQGSVVVNGGTAPVARQGDPVGFLWYTIANVAGVPVVVNVGWSATTMGYGAPPMAPAPGNYQVQLTITGGASHFTG